ncbi:MAG: HNH endonuclease [Acidimicrobiia bacterium]
MLAQLVRETRAFVAALDVEHNIPWAQGGPTTLENLARLCHHHHDLKTRRDLRRLGPPGRQRLVDREEFERQTAPTRAA